MARTTHLSSRDRSHQCCLTCRTRLLTQPHPEFQARCRSAGTSPGRWRLATMAGHCQRQAAESRRAHPWLPLGSYPCKGQDVRRDAAANLASTGHVTDWCCASVPTVEALQDIKPVVGFKRTFACPLVTVCKGGACPRPNPKFTRGRSAQIAAPSVRLRHSRLAEPVRSTPPASVVWLSTVSDRVSNA